MSTAHDGARLYLSLETDLAGDWQEVIPSVFNNGDMISSWWPDAPLHYPSREVRRTAERGRSSLAAQRPGTCSISFRFFPSPQASRSQERRPSYSQYQNRGYYMGLGSDNAMVDEHRRFSRQGIQAPTVTPTLTAAAGPGSTGAAVTRIAWYDSLTDEWGVQSAPSDVVNLTNQKRTTGNIPTTAPEPRITHVGVWVEMDGAASRLSTLRQVGVSTITEGVATLALGIAYPVPFSRMPRCAYNTMYHDRQVGAGDARNPDLVYVSQLGFPERWGGLAFRTRNGEPVIALVANRDVCLVLTPFSSYVLRGFTDDDMSLTLTDGDIGALNHWVWTVIHDVIWGANEKGVFIWNQGWHQMNLDLENYWTTLYKAHPGQFENAFCLVDPNYQTYSIYMNTGPGAEMMVSAEVPDLNGVFPATFAWVAKYSSVTPQVGGSLSQPQWCIDIMDWQIDSAGLLGLPGARRRDPYLGRYDGMVMTPADLNDPRTRTTTATPTTRCCGCGARRTIWVIPWVTRRRARTG